MGVKDDGQIRFLKGEPHWRAYAGCFIIYMVALPLNTGHYFYLWVLENIHPFSIIIIMASIINWVNKIPKISLFSS